MEDCRIIELYFNRNERAIIETSDKYGQRLHRLSVSVTENESDSDECVNDTYLEAWNRIPPTRPDHLFAWLAKVVRNSSNKVWERRNAQKRSARVTELSDELAECIPDTATVESQLESARLNACIEDFIRRLDDNQRLVFMQRYFWSRSLSEISAETGYPESKLKSMLFRIRNKLKTRLRKEQLL